MSFRQYPAKKLDKIKPDSDHIGSNISSTKLPIARPRLVPVDKCHGVHGNRPVKPISSRLLPLCHSLSLHPSAEQRSKSNLDLNQKSRTVPAKGCGGRNQKSQTHGTTTPNHLDIFSRRKGASAYNYTATLKTHRCNIYLL